MKGRNGERVPRANGMGQDTIDTQVDPGFRIYHVGRARQTVPETGRARPNPIKLRKPRNRRNVDASSTFV